MAKKKKLKYRRGLGNNDAWLAVGQDGGTWKHHCLRACENPYNRFTLFLEHEAPANIGTYRDSCLLEFTLLGAPVESL